jgi:RNA polymerase-associated protein CTR9
LHDRYRTLIGDALQTLTHFQSQKLQPADKSITYNIAVLEQKAAEMLFVVPPAKRNLGELEQAIEQAGHAQTFVRGVSSWGFSH